MNTNDTAQTWWMGWTNSDTSAPGPVAGASSPSSSFAARFSAALPFLAFGFLIYIAARSAR